MLLKCLLLKERKKFIPTSEIW